MRWNEFLDTADRLSHGATEGDWRSAISRGYYALFHFFRQFFLTYGLNLGRGGQSHFNLYSGLLNCGIPTVAGIASQIDSLRSLRVQADYDLNLGVLQQTALDAVGKTRLAITDFQTALGTVSATQIADGARRHLQSIGHLGRTP